MAKQTSIYTYRGQIERRTATRIEWRTGYSAISEDGNVIYPFMTKRECQADAKAQCKRAVFVIR